MRYEVSFYLCYNFVAVDSDSLAVVYKDSVLYEGFFARIFFYFSYISINEDIIPDFEDSINKLEAEIVILFVTGLKNGKSALLLIFRVFQGPEEVFR